eukprot:scaffold58990_cov22-Tisochrysis_lutea.AAC.2
MAALHVIAGLAVGDGGSAGAAVVGSRGGAAAGALAIAGTVSPGDIATRASSPSSSSACSSRKCCSSSTSSAPIPGGPSSISSLRGVRGVRGEPPPWLRKRFRSLIWARVSPGAFDGSSTWPADGSRARASRASCLAARCALRSSPLCASSDARRARSAVAACP